MWAVMMVGMMTPSAAPMILLHARVARQAAAQGKALAATGWFAAGYVFSWTVFSLAATLLEGALEHAALMAPMMAVTSRRASGIILHPRGPVPVDVVQGRMSAPLPRSVAVHPAARRFRKRRRRFVPSRSPPRALLHRMLLGTDGAALRGRRDEHRLDCRALDLRADREGRSGRHGRSPPSRERRASCPVSGS